MSCSPNPCALAHRAQCVELTGAVSCGCDPGFELDAAGQCMAKAVCTASSCTLAHRGVCSDVGGSAVCGCDVGYEDHQGACVQVDPCNPTPCIQPNQGVCTAGGDAGFGCGCNTGYQAGATGCELIPAPVCTNQHAAGDSFEPDECPALSKVILDGVAQAHTFDRAGDVDFMKFTVGASTVVKLEETGPLATSVSLFNPDGTTLLVSNAAEQLIYKVPDAGTYFFEARATTASTTGNTSLKYTDLGPDDFGDTVATATPVALGSLVGRFDFPSDWDVVGVPVQAGRIYRFEETSSTDVYVRLDSAVGPIVSTQDLPESIVLKASGTQTLYFGVRNYSSALGVWAAKFSDLGTDDQADGFAGATALLPAASPGTALSGSFEYPSDFDCLAVPVQASRIYRFEETTPFDVYLKVLTATGTLVSLTDNESVTFKAPTTETLAFCIRPYGNSSTGAWGIRVADLGVDDQADDRLGAAVLTPVGPPGAALSGTFEAPGDIDCLAVPVQAARIYRFEETTAFDISLNVLTPTGTLVSLTDNENVTFKSAVSQTLYFCVRAYSSSSTGGWGIRVIDLGTDDQADDRAGATTLSPLVAPGASVAGAFDYPGDVDCFAVPTEVGHAYRFEETTPVDVTLTVLTATGTRISLTDDESVSFKASATETLYFCARAYSGGTTGAWAFRATDLGLDDHSDVASAATPVTIDAAATAGELQFTGDVDWFGFSAPSALALRVITTGIASQVHVENASGVALANGSGPGVLTFSVPSAGSYFVRINGSLGTYTVRVAN